MGATDHLERRVNQSPGRDRLEIDPRGRHGQERDRVGLPLVAVRGEDAGAPAQPVCGPSSHAHAALSAPPTIRRGVRGRVAGFADLAHGIDGVDFVGGQCARIEAEFVDDAVEAIEAAEGGGGPPRWWR